MSQLNLPHETNYLKAGKTKTKKKEKRTCSEVSVGLNSPRGIRGVSPEEEKEGYVWEDFQKRKFALLAMVGIQFTC